jgi:hypothetical protein
MKPRILSAEMKDFDHDGHTHSLCISCTLMAKEQHEEQGAALKKLGQRRRRVRLLSIRLRSICVFFESVKGCIHLDLTNLRLDRAVGINDNASFHILGNLSRSATCI